MIIIKPHMTTGSAPITKPGPAAAVTAETAPP